MSDSEKHEREPEAVPPPPPAQDNPSIVEHFERSRKPGEDETRRENAKEE